MIAIPTPNAPDALSLTSALTGPIPLAAEGGGEATHSVGPIQTALLIVLVVVGTFFLVVGTVGLIRLPNVYNRMHATSKATTLGAASIALAGFVFYGPGGDGLMSLVIVVFLFLTAPTGAHMISRAAQRMGIDFLEDVSWPAPPPDPPEDARPDDSTAGPNSEEDGDGSAAPSDD